MREEEKRENNSGPEEPVGRGRPKVVVNLTKSFDDLDAALDNISKEGEHNAEATSSESPIQLRKKKKFHIKNLWTWKIFSTDLICYWENMTLRSLILH